MRHVVKKTPPTENCSNKIHVEVGREITAVTTIQGLASLRNNLSEAFEFRNKKAYVHVVVRVKLKVDRI